MLGKITIKKNTLVLLEANRELSLEENTKKTKCMGMAHHQNAGQDHSVRIDNKSFENMVKFKYLGITVTNQNCIHEELRAFCSEFLSSHLLSKILKY